VQCKLTTQNNPNELTLSAAGDAFLGLAGFPDRDGRLPKVDWDTVAIVAKKA
jgi:hypothetical protein